MKSLSFSARQSTFVEGLHSSRITRLTKASELSKSRTIGRLYAIERVSMTGILSGLGSVLAPVGMGFGVDFSPTVRCGTRRGILLCGQASPNIGRVGTLKFRVISH